MFLYLVRNITKSHSLIKQVIKTKYTFKTFFLNDTITLK